MHGPTRLTVHALLPRATYSSQITTIAAPAISSPALTAADLENLVLTELHQGAIEVFINGTQNCTQRGNNRSCEEIYEREAFTCRQSLLRRASVADLDQARTVFATALRDGLPPFRLSIAESCCRLTAVEGNHD